MQLSRRLQAVADLVTQGLRIADVGCDHAYTSIYLADWGISPQVIAMDVNQGPVDKAKENVKRYGCADRIEVRKSDGLEKLKPGEVDSILIGGMGGALTIEILKKRPDILKEIKELILQPQSEICKVRKMLMDSGFLIIKENMVLEEGKYYMMMKAVQQTSVENKEDYVLTKQEHLYYGRLLLEAKHPILREYLNWELGICEEVLQNLNTEQTENSLARKKDFLSKIELIHSGLEYFDKE
jgi:tRNA (adenine22-N1)-methyltransferase